MELIAERRKKNESIDRTVKGWFAKGLDMSTKGTLRGEMYVKSQFEVSFITRAEIWDIAEKHDYGDIHPDDWEGHVWKFFKDKMDEYMAGQSILNANS